MNSEQIDVKSKQVTITREARNSSLVTRNSSLRAGYWLLATGCWLLATAPAALLLFAAGCSSSSPTNKNNGVYTGVESVWTDVTTGLIWQSGPSVGYDGYDWANAVTYCSTLSWDGYTDWRLPSVSEMRSLLRGCDATRIGGACAVTDECLSFDACWNAPCNGCLARLGPGPQGAYWPPEVAGEIYGPYAYWTSSAVADENGYAWPVYFNGGYVTPAAESYNFFSVRCVR